MAPEWLGLVITLVGGLITHLAGYQLYKYKLKSVFRKCNELEKRLAEGEQRYQLKADFRDALVDLKADMRDVRDQLHSLVVALAKGRD